ncbi:MAG: ABC transporter ATP-binding protein [Taibaiella sp.]|nr:ABC transporter ATP-binding protein [Taibaiella sp.]
MKKLPLLLRYLRGNTSQITLYFITNLLAILFSLFSFTMLAPVMQVLFAGSARPVLKAHPSFTDKLLFNFDSYILHFRPIDALLYAVIIVVSATVLKNLFLYISVYILNPLRNMVLRKLRNDLFTKILSLPIGFFTEERKGDLISKMTNDINEVELSIMSILEVFIREPLTIILTFVGMIIISPQLTLFLVIFLPIAGIALGRVGKSMKRPSNLAQEQLGAMMGVMDETLAGMRVVKAFNAEKNQHLKFTEINNKLFRYKNRIAARRELASPLSETLGVIIVGVILWYGGKLIFSKETSLTGPLFITFITFFYMLIAPFKNLSNAFYNVQKGTAALERIEQLLNTNNTIKELPDAKPIKMFEQSIEFKNVSFQYGELTILDGLNLRIEKGKMIALVGASGAGKSTLVDLIPRFHDVSSGEILIDGINIKEYKIDDLRRLMGVVSQEPILFNDTIYSNITLGTGGATQQDVENAASIAHSHNFILQKKDGYQTTVGDRGSRLSGGERQRVTIARAVLKNPPILILDEATSSLDTESERLVQDAINNLMQNRTCIVIAHRLSTVQHADEIIVLDKGEIVERGNHTALLNSNGLYKRLVDMQQVK